MRPANFTELVFQSLPDDVRPEELTSIGKPELWKTSPREAISRALRQSPRINWQAYLENYPDIREAGIDPVEHFLQSGIFENRRLYSWHPLHKPVEGAPALTVVITNYNNGPFLEKCLESVLAQSQINLEIIIVDDHSDDDSLEIINSFASQDSRIRVIALPENKGLHMARKAGVKEARGGFLMFLDSDDFLAADASKIALGEISKGYDMAEFNVNVINHANLPPRTLQDFIATYNRLPPGKYGGQEILNAAYLDDRLSHKLINKILVTAIARAAFEEMEDGRFDYDPDLYEFLLLAYKSRSLIKLEETLYNKSCKPSKRSWPDYDWEPVSEPRLLEHAGPIQRYCEANFLETIGKRTRDVIFADCLLALPLLDAESANAYFHNLMNTFGVLDTAVSLLKQRYSRWEEVTSKFCYFNAPQKPVQSNKIGIYYLKVSPGGVETTILNLVRLLRQNGKDVALFLQQRTEYDILVAPYVEIHYLTNSVQQPDSDAQHVRDLYQAVKLSGVDTVLYMFVVNPITTWDTILLKMMGVAVIGSVRLDPNYDFLTRGRPYAHSAFLQTLRCQDKVFCLNTSTEIYLRAQGIDAVYLPNAIRQTERALPQKKPGTTIVVIARLHERLKKIRQCLKVLNEVRKSIPNVRMIFVGGFDVPETKELFYESVRDMQLGPHITVTDWTSDPFPYIDSADVLFSASFLEGFPNGIAEAQSRGLPVVMYHLDIMMAKGNESIIQVAQDDYKGAAREIVALLKDDALRLRLGEIAKQEAAKFSGERFFNNIMELLATFRTSSVCKYYTPGEYLTAIRGMAFYGGKTVPEY